MYEQGELQDLLDAKGVGRAKAALA